MRNSRKNFILKKIKKTPGYRKRWGPVLDEVLSKGFYEGVKFNQKTENRKRDLSISQEKSYAGKGKKGLKWSCVMSKII